MENVLDNAEWIAKAGEICDLVGHKAEKSYASHVEKQLIAYYLDRHAIFVETDPVRAVALHTVTPPHQNVKGTITVSKEKACFDCERFIALVREKFAVNLDFHFTE